MPTQGQEVHIDVQWQSDGGFIGTTPEGRRVVMGDVGEEKGLRPMELLLASVAGCSGVDVVLILQKMRVPFTDLRIQIRGERRALSKYCSASATVAAHAEITYDIQLHPVQDGA